MDSYISNLLFGNVATGVGVGILVTILMIWALIWKGVALWHAVKNHDRYWFIAMLILNTAGILEIAYLFYFSKNKLKPDPANIKKLITFLKPK